MREYRDALTPDPSAQWDEIPKADLLFHSLTNSKLHFSIH